MNLLCDCAEFEDFFYDGNLLKLDSRDAAEYFGDYRLILRKATRTKRLIQDMIPSIPDFSSYDIYHNKQKRENIKPFLAKGEKRLH